MKRKKILLLLSCFALLGVTTSWSHGQDGTAVKGRIVQAKRKEFNIPWTELGTQLVQQVEFPKPPLPVGWSNMEIKQREAWIQEFRESDEGKKFIANNERIQKSIEVFDVLIEKDGSFVVYDVPPGRYGLRGRVDKDLNNRKFAFEIFGQVDVLKDVDELNLDQVMILVTPLLEAGQAAPSFSLKTADDSAEVTASQFQGKYLFLNFWSTESPPSVEFQAEIQVMFAKLNSKHPIELLSVCVDNDRSQAISQIRKSSLKGQHGFTDGWDHRILDSYGVRAIPSYWLIGTDGKLLMTHLDFRRAFFSGLPDLATIIEDRIQKKEVPVPAPAADKKTPKAKP